MFNKTFVQVEFYSTTVLNSRCESEAFHIKISCPVINKTFTRNSIPNGKSFVKKKTKKTKQDLVLFAKSILKSNDIVFTWKGVRYNHPISKTCRFYAKFVSRKICFLLNTNYDFTVFLHSSILWTGLINPRLWSTMKFYALCWTLQYNTTDSSLILPGKTCRQSRLLSALCHLQFSL